MTPPDPPIEVARALAQHAAYTAALAACGLEVTSVPADDACPDCVFVEDTAVVAGGLALITRPGAPSRRPETPPIAAALGAWLRVVHMEAPATLDGGDVLRLGTTLYVGRSARTNAAGIARLAEVFEPHGFAVVAVDLPPSVLHLKCVCSPLAAGALLVAESSLPATTFPGAELLWVPTEETYAANAVAVDRHVVIAAEFPRTRELLDRAGYVVHPVPTTEVRKADGSLTCQSILV